MEKISTHKTVSITELRDPSKVLDEANGSTVAVLKNNKVVAYLVPKTEVDIAEPVSTDELDKVLKNNKVKHQPVLDYLKDK